MLAMEVAAYKAAQSSDFPFFKSDIKYSVPKIHQITKDEIIGTFVSQFNKFQVKGKATMTEPEINEYLSQYNSMSNNGIGAEIDAKIKEYLGSNVLTGTGFYIQDSDGESVEANIKTESARLMNQILDRLQEYLNVLSNFSDDILYSEIIRLMKSAGRVPNTPIKVRNGILNGRDIENLDERAISNIQKIANALTVLKSSMSTGKINTLNIDDDWKSIKNISNAVGASLGVLGSESIHEPLIAHCTNIVLAKEKKVLKEIDNCFNGTHFRKAKSTGAEVYKGEGRMKGKQTIDDVSFEWAGSSEGGYIRMTNYISAKLRQSNWNFNKNNPGQVKGELKHGGISIGELLAIATKGSSVASFEQNWAAVLNSPLGKHTYFVKKEVAGLATAWQEFKQTASKIALYRAFVSNDLNVDFASILIVNNRVFSMYDILTKIDDKSIIRFARNDSSFPSYNEIYLKFSESLRQKKSKYIEDEKTREEETRDLIKTIYSKKVSMAIQLSNLVKALS